MIGPEETGVDFQRGQFLAAGGQPACQGALSGADTISDAVAVGAVESAARALMHREYRPGTAVPRHAFVTRIIDVPAIDVSATLVRSLVARGRSIRYLVPDGVREYIAAHGLYR